MASALAAIHASHQYHTDLIPSNILIDDDKNAILIDWEQSGVSRFFVAPEVNGSWDVETERLQTDTNENVQDSIHVPYMIY